MADNSYSDDEAFDNTHAELMIEAFNLTSEMDNYIRNYAQNNHVSYRGSIPGHIVINRDRENADRILFNDYFSENHRFPESMFRRRFRMSRTLFVRILDVVQSHDNYFLQRRDGCGKFGLSCYQKVTAVFRMLSYGVAADATDEYVKIGESTVLEAFKRFCRAIVEVFGERYLRTPNANDVARLLQVGEQRGFPGMLAGTAPPANYVIKGKSYNMGYYLADGIYPKWVTLVQSIHDPRGPKKQYFAKKQEVCRKDVKRAFGVLQSRFAIVAGLARLWRKKILHDIMTSCIIMHNMIIEDERDINAPIEERSEVQDVGVEMMNDGGLEQFLVRHKKIKDKDAHFKLRNALIDHL
ncbi:uncharacterized protein LOC112511324 [Cynara cardunculus var. scolymus]|uniref:uncharacterized protein LOC112511324 n=1 Tax=Cynara cardunculus var. scolymus TaxID=59895 RepID=UPI000D62E0F9|nr:uncharacterized protein LOC112511324 [Cynara cardunculus var. scolymus]